MKAANCRRTPASHNRAHAGPDENLKRKLRNPAFRAATRVIAFGRKLKPQMDTDETQINPAKDYSLQPITEQIIGAAFEVHKRMVF